MAPGKTAPTGVSTKANKRLKLALLWGLLSIGTVVLLLYRSELGRERQESAAPLAGVRDQAQGSAPQTRRTAADPATHGPIILTGPFRQSIEYTRGQRELSIINKELPPSAVSSEARSFEVSTYDYSVAYELADVAGRQAYEFYVAGNYPSGMALIEKWTHEINNGAYYCTRTPSGTLIGTPLPGFPSVSVGVQGGTYLPASQRLRPGRQARVVLWSSSAIPDIRCLCCDPEARFLLFVAGTAPRTLYQLALVPNSQPIALYSAAQYPHLDSVNCIGVTQFQALGRAYELVSTRADDPTPMRSTMLFDPDNDGVINGIQTLSVDEYLAAGYEHMPRATDFIVNY